MSKPIRKSIEDVRFICAPRDHNFTWVDVTPNFYPLNSRDNLGQDTPPRTVRLFCTKCGQIRPVA